MISAAIRSKAVEIISAMEGIIAYLEKASACGAGSVGAPGFDRNNTCQGGGGSGGSSSGSSAFKISKRELSSIDKDPGKAVSAFSRAASTLSVPSKKEAGGVLKRAMSGLGKLAKKAAVGLGSAALKAGKALSKKLYTKAKSMVTEEMSRVFGDRRTAVLWVASSSLLVLSGASAGALFGGAFAGGALAGAAVAAYQTGGKILRDVLGE